MTFIWFNIVDIISVPSNHVIQALEELEKLVNLDSFIKGDYFIAQKKELKKYFWNDEKNYNMSHNSNYFI